MPLEPDDEERIAKKKAAGVIGRPTAEVMAERTTVALERIATALEAQNEVMRASHAVVCADAKLRADAALLFQQGLAHPIAHALASGSVPPDAEEHVRRFQAGVAGLDIPPAGTFEPPADWTPEGEAP